MLAISPSEDIAPMVS